MTKAEIRTLERSSLRAFLEKYRSYLVGRVLDYGCGLSHTCVKPQPYRDLVLGEYVPYDKGYPKPDGTFDTILLTQVVQFIADWPSLLVSFHQRTKRLVVTYPTHWEEVEPDDLLRYTRRGMEHFVTRAGFRIVVHEARWSLPFEDFALVGGYGLIAEVL